jgi:hypothetical protein
MLEAGYPCVAASVRSPSQPRAIPAGGRRCSTKQNDHWQYLNWIDDSRKPYTLRIDMKLQADGSRPGVLQAFGASLPASRKSARIHSLCSVAVREVDAFRRLAILGRRSASRTLL